MTALAARILWNLTRAERIGAAARFIRYPSGGLPVPVQLAVRCSPSGPRLATRRKPVELLCPGHWQRLYDSDCARALLGHQPFRDEGRDLGFGQGFTVLRNHIGDDGLAAALVGHAHHPGRGDLWMGVDHLLDLTGEDVEALDQDHILLAVGDEEEAVLVQMADIAGVDEAVAQDLRRFLRAVAVA